MIHILSSVTSTIGSVEDTRKIKMTSSDFLHNWGRLYKDVRSKYFITRENREGIDVCIYGFLHIVEIGTL